MSNNKNIDYAIKYIKLAIEDYDKFLMEIDKLPEKQKKEILVWLRNALKYVDKNMKRNKK
tara:strand:+ start:585 stop:764 length:180 start_codon:yes stop_codon:yes gene_type:complete